MRDPAHWIRKALSAHARGGIATELDAATVKLYGSGAQREVRVVGRTEPACAHASRDEDPCDRKPFAKDELISVDDRFEIDVADNVTAFAICSRCVKTRFVDYTDRTLSKRITRDGADAHLGLMGPVLHGRVGQAIIIHFRNNASEPVSMHPHDGSSHREKRDDSIAPGGSYIYRCHVPLRAGPGPGRSQRNRCLTDEQLKALMENEDFEVSKLCILLPTLFTAMDPASILRKANLRASTFTIWALKLTSTRQ
ncbi:Hephaestin-like protein [Gracilariopsis chorda]|uniref:Hephaestin-like protein n=1 Tax=Gracilariopsis chorda TaxID=448386 RepID=A0A2V3ICJ5_9FLOR|nr:Hephaestin-like protein [Gracilariopsis chorda]|eukprot:PXF39809.1 Hephaestin-like protein [Gracilariopsis chorda]